MNSSVVATFRRTLSVFEKQMEMLSVLLKEDIANRWTDKGKQLIEEVQLAALILKRCYQSEATRYERQIYHLDKLAEELSSKKSSIEWKNTLFQICSLVNQEALEGGRSNMPPSSHLSFIKNMSQMLKKQQETLKANVQLKRGPIGEYSAIIRQPVPKEVVIRYARGLGLRPQALSWIQSGYLQFERWEGIVKEDLNETVRRFDGMDAYAQDKGEGVVDAEPATDKFYLFSPKGLAAGGVIVRTVRGEDIGYSLFYRVIEEKKIGLTPLLAATRTRANWRKIAVYLSRVFGRDVQEKHLWHHYDYTIKNESFRMHGLAKLVLRLGYDTVIPKDGIAVGFIDPQGGHLISFVTASKVGALIGHEVPASPDGPHTSFLEVYSQSFPLYTFMPKKVFKKGTNLNDLPFLFRRHFKDNQFFLLGWDSSSQDFKPVQFSRRLNL